MKISLVERLLSTRKGRLGKLKSKVIQFLSQPSEAATPEKSQILDFLKENEINVFPYTFVKEYSQFDVDVKFDDKLGLYFCIIDGKKLYYKDQSLRKAKSYFKAILIEQDQRSPHRYLSEEFNVEENDIVLDVGSADGNFSLSIIEKVKHVYLFEPDQDWTKALAATFADWKDKVTIINKFISDNSYPEKNIAKLDDLIDESRPVNFIKTDVEGSEIDLLNGCKRILESNTNLKVAICTYHNQDDAERIETILNSHNFQCGYSPGYMLYYYGRSNIVKEPYLRRAVLRAKKRS